jgi:hypothetical protein
MTSPDWLVFLRLVLSEVKLISLLLNGVPPAARAELADLLAALAGEAASERLEARTNRLYRKLLATPAGWIVRNMYVEAYSSPAGTHEGERGDGDASRPAERRDSAPESLAQELHQQLSQARKVIDEPSPAVNAFHFVLRGTAAHGNSMEARTRATLAFHYAPPPEDALTVGDVPALDSARHASLDLMLIASTTGAIDVVGTQVGRARFENGMLKAPVMFTLQAREPGEAAVQIEYLVRGETVHQTVIDLRVLPAGVQPSPGGSLTEARCALGLTPEEMTKLVAPPPDQRIVMNMGFAGGPLRITLTDYRHGDENFTDEFQAESLDATRIQSLLKRIHADLRPLYDDEDMWLHFDGTLPDSEEERSIVGQALSKACDRMALAGSRMNEELRSDPRIAQALDYIEMNARAGARLSISTDNTFLPWELLYPEHRSALLGDEPDRPADTLKFWGARFAIETQQRGIGELSRLRREHLSHAPKVTMNLNPSIKITGEAPERQPMAVHRAWGNALAERGRLDGIQATCKEMRPVLRDAATAATLIYVYCHGNAPDALGSGADENLALDANCVLEPRDLRARPMYRAAPIVFLNSCKAGVSSPLTLSNFLREFRLRGALGMIATSYSVPVAYGARLGREIVGCYLDRLGSLADELLKLRQQRLRDAGDPVPLLYTLQCHLDALPEPAPAAPEGEPHG